MSFRSNPQDLLNTLVQTNDVTPDRVRQALNDAVPLPASSSTTNAGAPDIGLDTAINYFKLNRK